MPYAGGQVHFITGDKAGNLWLSEDRSLLHLRDGRGLEQIPWSRLGRPENASVLLSAREPGGLWLGFWRGGGVSYFKDGQVRASYTAANGLGAGALSPIFGSIRMARCGPPPWEALAGLKMAVSRRSPPGTDCPATPFTGRWRTTIIRSGRIRPAVSCASPGPN